MPQLRKKSPKPRWTSPEHFTLGGLRFRSVTKDFKSHFTTAEEVAILKGQGMVSWYRDYLSSRPMERVLNLGIFQGGSELFILAACPDARLLAIDLSDPVESVGEIARKRGWGDRIQLHFNTSQDDEPRLRELIDGFAGGQKLSLVVDDASHLYQPTKRAFEIAFPYLEVGCDYIIEDWGWANWSGNFQEPDGQWSDQPALTNFIFELVMLAASRPDIISRVELVSPAIAVIKRGAGWPHGAPMSVDSLYLSRGKTLELL